MTPSLIKNYTIQELQPDFSWLDIGTTETPEFLFEVGKTYRIVTNYNNQLGAVPSEKFTIGSAPILGQSSIANFSVNSLGEAIAPTSTPPTIFFTFASDELISDEFTNEGRFLSVATKKVTPTSTPPTIFFTFSSSNVIDDEFTNEGKFLSVATKALKPISTPPPIFFTT